MPNLDRIKECMNIAKNVTPSPNKPWYECYAEDVEFLLGVLEFERATRTNMTGPQMLDKFRTAVCEKSKDVDEKAEHEWFSLAYGFFLGLGNEIEDAHFLANEATYRYKYWQNK